MTADPAAAASFAAMVADMERVAFEDINAGLVGRVVEIVFPDGATSHRGQSRLAGTVATVSEFGSAINIQLSGSNDSVLVRPMTKKMFSKETVEPRGNPQVFLTS